jgi:hypothetical protein
MSKSQRQRGQTGFFGMSGGNRRARSTLPNRYQEISVRLLIITAVFLLTELASALADVRILASPGGDVVPFLKLFGTLRYSGERVTIDGPCYSACTLVLSEISRNRICVTSRAVLGFHAERASRPGSNILIRSQGRAADTLIPGLCAGGDRGT